MVEEAKSQLSGVLDGDMEPSGIPLSERGQHAQSAIEDQLAEDRVQAEMAANAPPPNPFAPWVATPSGAGQVTTAAPGTGGGYHFDPQQIAAMIPKWQQELDAIKEDRDELEAARRKANPPSADTPASQNAKATRDSIQAAIDQNMLMQQYAEAWIKALSKANGTYVEHDQQTGDDLNNVGSAMDGHNLNK